MADPAETFKHLCDQFNISLSDVRLIPLYSGRGYRFFRFLKIAVSSIKYDLFINSSTRAVIPAFSMHSIYVNHFPPSPLTRERFGFIGRVARLFGGFLFKKTWSVYASNSQYSDSWLERYWDIPKERRTILYPPIIENSAIPSEIPDKKNIIITVGRIGPEKHQKELSDVFCRYYHELFQGYELCIVGPAPHTEEERLYISEIENLSRGFPVRFRYNLKQEELCDLYKDSKIYWHARGLGVDEEKDPFHVEHFGMTTAEAMAFGVVPVVIKKGGQKEIVSDDVNGYTWDTLDECAAKTCMALIPENYQRLSREALNSSHQYTIEKFNGKLDSILQNVLHSEIS